MFKAIGDFLSSDFGVGLTTGIRDVVKTKQETLQKEVNDIAEMALRFGLPKMQKLESERRNLREQAKQLQRYNFSTDQIGLILGNKKGQAVLDHIESLQSAGLKYNVSDIAQLAPDVKATGKTIDQFIMDVTGKVNRGMGVTDAVVDASTFPGLDRSVMEQKRSDVIKKLTGLSLDEVKAYARDDLEYGETPEGTINLFDPLKAKAAEKALRDEPKDGDIPISSQRFAQKAIYSAYGAETSVDPRGYLVFDSDKNVIDAINGFAKWEQDWLRNNKDVNLKTSEGRAKYQVDSAAFAAKIREGGGGTTNGGGGKAPDVPPSGSGDTTSKQLTTDQLEKLREDYKNNKTTAVRRYLILTQTTDAKKAEEVLSGSE